MDNNGPVGIFLMNVMLAAGGYPWIVIPLDKPTDYMNTLENASVKQDRETQTVLPGDLVSDNR